MFAMFLRGDSNFLVGGGNDTNEDNRRAREGRNPGRATLSPTPSCRRACQRVAFGSNVILEKLEPRPSLIPARYSVSVRRLRAAWPNPCLLPVRCWA